MFYKYGWRYFNFWDFAMKVLGYYEMNSTFKSKTQPENKMHRRPSYAFLFLYEIKKLCLVHLKHLQLSMQNQLSRYLYSEFSFIYLRHLQIHM
jgi:hypothetical protein